MRPRSSALGTDTAPFSETRRGEQGEKHGVDSEEEQSEGEGTEVQEVMEWQERGGDWSVMVEADGEDDGGGTELSAGQLKQCGVPALRGGDLARLKQRVSIARRSESP